jgi:hypothetical protein
VTLWVTNVATDNDIPAQSLSYALLVSPGGAAINTNSGLISWRPPVASAGTTNLFTVRVTDNGVGNLAATQSFNAIVNTLNRPSLSGAQFTTNQLRLVVNGDFGPDYTVQASTNLMTWGSVYTTNSPALPFNWTDAGAAGFGLRFYRIMVGP